VVPLTVAMHLTGSITGGLSAVTFNNFLLQAAVHNNLDYGVVGADISSGFAIFANGQRGVGSFADSIVSATGTMQRATWTLPSATPTPGMSAHVA
jgi:hypothetical protein